MTNENNISLLDSRNSRVLERFALENAKGLARDGKYSEAAEIVREFGNGIPNNEQNLARRAGLARIALDYYSKSGLESTKILPIEFEENKAIDIDKEFPYDSKEHYDNPTNKTVIKKIQHNCARAAEYSSIESSLAESSLHRTKALMKTLWTLGLTLGTTYLVDNFKDLHEFVNTITLPLVPFAIYQLKLNLFGRHVFTGVGTYYKAPYFSIFDEIKLGNNWKRIANLQKSGKLPQGNREIKTEDCYLELGRNQFGGP